MRIHSRVTLALSAVSVIGCERPAARPKAVDTPSSSAEVGIASGVTTAPAPLTLHDEFRSTSSVPGPGHTVAVIARGTSKLSGLVNGSFTLLDSAVIAPGGKLHINRTLTGNGGTILITLDARFVGSSATTDTVRGQWTITSGSGTYFDLRGSGGYDSIVHTATETISGTGSGYAFRHAGT